MSQASTKVTMSPDETAKLMKFMETTFKTPGMNLRMRPQAVDSVEVLLNGEFIGLIHKDVDEGETSYVFTVSILDIDLEG